MCLSTVYWNSVNERQQLIKDITRIEVDGDGLWLIDLFGERRFIEARIKFIDFMDGQCLVLENRYPVG
jgi:predicted RNA-binding protein